MLATLGCVILADERLDEADPAKSSEIGIGATGEDPYASERALIAFVEDLKLNFLKFFQSGQSDSDFFLHTQSGHR